MANVEATVTIVRPVEEVFRFFLDLDKNGSHMDPSIESVVKTSLGPTRPGIIFRFRQRILGKVRDTTTTFTSLEPNRKIEIAASFGPLRPNGAISFAEGNQGTTVPICWKWLPTVRPQSNTIGLRPVGQRAYRNGITSLRKRSVRREHSKLRWVGSAY